MSPTLTGSPDLWCLVDVTIGSTAISLVSSSSGKAGDARPREESEEPPIRTPMTMDAMGMILRFTKLESAEIALSQINTRKASSDKIIL